jgi:uncharacterized membrane protein
MFHVHKRESPDIKGQNIVIERKDEDGLFVINFSAGNEAMMTQQDSEMQQEIEVDNNDEEPADNHGKG